MAEDTSIDLRKIVYTRNALVKYRDDTYISMIKALNEQCQDILKDDLGSQFVISCGRDLAGEVVRNYFDASNYYLTVDQLAERILKFDYENEYDPLQNSDQYKKDVLNYNEIKPSETLNGIIKSLDDSQNKLKLFIKEENEKGHKEYADKKMIEKAKSEYVNNKKNADGSINDEYTGGEGEYITYIDKDGQPRSKRREQVDHTQALAIATYNEKYIKEKGVNALREVYNSEANFAMMLDTANQSKGDVKVRDKNGNDITHRATPEQYADAIIARWEKIRNLETKQKLIDKGYLDSDGKVPKHIKNKLRENIRRSQNAESKVILKNAKYGTIAKDAVAETEKSLGKIIAGQIIYYAAPPLVFEIRGILHNKPSSIDDAIDKLSGAGKSISGYVSSKLKIIFKNVTFNVLKNFVKVFMDILINLVKATIKRLLKLVKNLVLATVDAVKILTKKDTTRSQKADAVCNLFGMTIATFVVDTLFELLRSGGLIPDFLIMPLQILSTVVCTNLTMLILQKADLFDVRHEFKIRSIEKLFSDARDTFNLDMMAAEEYASGEIEMIIEQAETDCRQVSSELMENNPYENEVRGHLSKISTMFGMDVDFDREWLKFIGVDLSVVPA